MGWRERFIKIFNKFRQAAGLIFSAFLIYILLKRSDLEWSDLKLVGAGLPFFLGGILISIFTIWAHSLRIKLLWLPRNNIDTLNGLLVGHFFNCTLPGNMGELMRSVHLSRKNNISISKSIASQIVEKLVDAFSFSLLVALWFLFVGWEGSIIDYLIGGTAAAIMIFLLVGIPFFIKPLLLNQFLKSVPFFPNIFRKIAVRMFYLILILIRDMRNRRVFIWYFLFGYGIFLLNILQYYCVMRALGLEDDLAHLAGAYFISLCMIIIDVIPAAPGNTGVLHFGVFEVTKQISILFNQEAFADLASLASYSIFLHLSIFLPEVILGGIALLRERKFIF